MKNPTFIRALFVIISICLLLSIYHFRTIDTPVTHPIEPSVFSPKDELNKTPYGQQLITLLEQSRVDPKQARSDLNNLNQSHPKIESPIYLAYRLMILLNIANLEKSTGSTSSYEKSLALLSETDGMSWLQATRLTDRSIEHAKQGELDDASQLIKKAITIAESIQYESLLMKSYNTAGVIHNIRTESVEAQTYFHKALKLGEKYPKNIYNGISTVNLALLYIYLEEWDKALIFINQAKEHYKNNNSANDDVMLILFTNESFLYLSQNLNEKARIAYEQAESYFTNTLNERLDVILLKAKSDLLLSERQYQQALEASNACLLRPHAPKYKLQQGQCYLLKAKINIALEQDSHIESDLIKALSLFNEVGSKRWAITTHMHLASFYETQKQINHSLAHLKSYYHGNNAMLFDKRKSELYYLEQKFNVKQIEQNNHLLTVKDELNTVRIEQQKFRGYIIFVAVSALTLGLCIMFFRNQELTVQTTTCSLTGLFNRRYLDQYLADRPTSQTASARCSIAILDLDKFKSINDTYGHDVGDEVLIEVAQRLKETLPDGDIVVRWGGEEFVCLLQGHQPPLNQLETIRSAICTLPVDSKVGKLNVSISIGAVTALNIQTL
ncbi:tetratricopeptide repeat-containing diguanylate cyclase [Aliivibrio kagoshimensis]|uniref:tetratricopeptide repeat-containing diguanylate cyclase n=1 Tax=Aliivibrio kagoshimensis TaxID=2910230 RepID=UPI003D13C399